MTNEELLNGLAQAVADKRNAEFPNSRIVANHFHYLGEAQAVIDHLAPMMREVIWDLQVLNSTDYKDNGSGDYNKAAMSLTRFIVNAPDCWKGGV